MHRLRFSRSWFTGRIPSGDRQGQTLVEYALILAVVSILALAVFSALGNRVVVVFSAITSLLDTAQAP
jgi:Flp pilus assembly pilin Flp